MVLVLMLVSFLTGIALVLFILSVLTPSTGSMDRTENSFARTVGPMPTVVDQNQERPSGIFGVVPMSYQTDARDRLPDLGDLMDKRYMHGVHTSCSNSVLTEAGLNVRAANMADQGPGTRDGR